MYSKGFYRSEKDNFSEKPLFISKKSSENKSVKKPLFMADVPDINFKNRAETKKDVNIKTATNVSSFSNSSFFIDTGFIGSDEINAVFKILDTSKAEVLSDALVDVNYGMIYEYFGKEIGDKFKSAFEPHLKKNDSVKEASNLDVELYEINFEWYSNFEITNGNFDVLDNYGKIGYYLSGLLNSDYWLKYYDFLEKSSDDSIKDLNLKNQSKSEYSTKILNISESVARNNIICAQPLLKTVLDLFYFSCFRIACHKNYKLALSSLPKDQLVYFENDNISQFNFNENESSAINVPPILSKFASDLDDINHKIKYSTNKFNVLMFILCGDLENGKFTKENVKALAKSRSATYSDYFKVFEELKFENYKVEVLQEENIKPESISFPNKLNPKWEYIQNEMTILQNNAYAELFIMLASDLCDMYDEEFKNIVIKNEYMESNVIYFNFIDKNEKEKIYITQRLLCLVYVFFERVNSKHNLVSGKFSDLLKKDNFEIDSLFSNEDELKNMLNDIYQKCLENGTITMRYNDKPITFSDEKNLHRTAFNKMLKETLLKENNFMSFDILVMASIVRRYFSESYDKNVQNVVVETYEKFFNQNYNIQAVGEGTYISENMNLPRKIFYDMINKVDEYSMDRSFSGDFFKINFASKNTEVKNIYSKFEISLEEKTKNYEDYLNNKRDLEGNLLRISNIQPSDRNNNESNVELYLNNTLKKKILQMMLERYRRFQNENENAKKILEEISTLNVNTSYVTKKFVLKQTIDNRVKLLNLFIDDMFSEGEDENRSVFILKYLLEDVFSKNVSNNANASNNPLGVYISNSTEDSDFSFILMIMSVISIFFGIFTPFISKYMVGVASDYVFSNTNLNNGVVNLTNTFDKLRKNMGSSIKSPFFNMKNSMMADLKVEKIEFQNINGIQNSVFYLKPDNTTLTKKYLEDSYERIDHVMINLEKIDSIDRYEFGDFKIFYENLKNFSGNFFRLKSENEDFAKSMPNDFTGKYYIFLTILNGYFLGDQKEKMSPKTMNEMLYSSKYLLLKTTDKNKIHKGALYESLKTLNKNSKLAQDLSEKDPVDPSIKYSYFLYESLRFNKENPNIYYKDTLEEDMKKNIISEKNKDLWKIDKEKKNKATFASTGVKNMLALLFGAATSGSRFVPHMLDNFLNERLGQLPGLFFRKINSMIYPPSVNLKKYNSSVIKNFYDETSQSLRNLFKMGNILSSNFVSSCIYMSDIFLLELSILALKNINQITNIDLNFESAMYLLASGVPISWATYRLYSIKSRSNIGSGKTFLEHLNMNYIQKLMSFKIKIPSLANNLVNMISCVDLEFTLASITSLISNLHLYNEGFSYYRLCDFVISNLWLWSKVQRERSIAIMNRLNTLYKNENLTGNDRMKLVRDILRDKPLEFNLIENVLQDVASLESTGQFIKIDKSYNLKKLMIGATSENMDVLDESGNIKADYVIQLKNDYFHNVFTITSILSLVFKTWSTVAIYQTVENDKVLRDNLNLYSMANSIDNSYNYYKMVEFAQNNPDLMNEMSGISGYLLTPENISDFSFKSHSLSNDTFTLGYQIFIFLGLLSKIKFINIFDMGKEIKKIMDFYKEYQKKTKIYENI